MANFYVTFFSINHFRRCPEIPGGYCVCLLLPPAHGSSDSVDQSTGGVCSSNLPAVPATLSGVSVPETSIAQYGSVRITSTFGGGNATRAAPLQTEPTRTLRWKCDIRFLPLPPALPGIRRAEGGKPLGPVQETISRT